jgi:cobalamin biosynthesis protein CbiD
MARQEATPLRRRWTPGACAAVATRAAFDDPDVTHGATIIAKVAWRAPGSGIDVARPTLAGGISVEVAVVDRAGEILARFGT